MVNKMALCKKHNKDLNQTTVPENECDVCISNAFNPKMCRIYREKEGCEIANSLVVCHDCEAFLFWFVN